MSYPLPRAILFDFDGVLAETMTDHFRAWKKSLSEFGVNLLPENYYPLEGLAMDQLAQKYCQENGIPVASSEKIISNKEKYYLLDHKFELYPEVDIITAELRRKKFPTAIVTTGLKDRLLKSVAPGFLAKFNTIVTGNDVERGKPFPDPYLKAARNLGVECEKCIVFENSPAGIKSAKAAGAYCVGITSTLTAEYLSEADEIIHRFRDLKNITLIRELHLF